MKWLAVGFLALLLGGVVAMVLVLWPRDDVPDAPAAVVVLGGAGSERAGLGIALADQHDAVLVLSSSAQHFAEGLGVRCGAEDVFCFEPEPPTTVGEARNVADLAAARDWEHVTVATSRFHAARARVVFRQCLGEAVSVVGAERPDRPMFVPRREFREALGVLASWTVQRAC